MKLSGILRGLLAALALVSFAANAVLSEDKPLRIGVTAGPHAQILEFVKKIAEKDGLKIQIVEFSDYVQPNAALAAGDLDVNSYQHQPYLDNANKDRGYNLVSITWFPSVRRLFFRLVCIQRSSSLSTRFRVLRDWRFPTIQPMAAGFSCCCRPRG